MYSRLTPGSKEQLKEQFFHQRMITDTRTDEEPLK